MSIKLGTNFEYLGPKFLDARQNLGKTLDDLKNWSTPIPEGFEICVLVDDVPTWYTYSKYNLEDPTTGSFSRRNSTTSNTIDALEEQFAILEEQVDILVVDAVETVTEGYEAAIVTAEGELRGVIDQKVDIVSNASLATLEEIEKLKNIEEGAEKNEIGKLLPCPFPLTINSEVYDGSQYVEVDIQNDVVTSVKGRYSDPTFTGIGKVELGLSDIGAANFGEGSEWARVSDLDLLVDKVSGKSLTSNNFTIDYFNKLEGIEENAQVNPTSVKSVNPIVINGVSYDGSEEVYYPIRGGADIKIVSENAGEIFSAPNENLLTYYRYGLTIDFVPGQQALTAVGDVYLLVAVNLNSDGSKTADWRLIYSQDKLTCTLVLDITSNQYQSLDLLGETFLLTSNLSEFEDINITWSGGSNKLSITNLLPGTYYLELVGDTLDKYSLAGGVKKVSQTITTPGEVNILSVNCETEILNLFLVNQQNESLSAEGQVIVDIVFPDLRTKSIPITGSSIQQKIPYGSNYSINSLYPFPLGFLEDYSIIAGEEVRNITAKVTSTTSTITLNTLNDTIVGDVINPFDGSEGISEGAIVKITDSIRKCMSTPIPLIVREKKYRIRFNGSWPDWAEYKYVRDYLTFLDINDNVVLWDEDLTTVVNYTIKGEVTQLNYFFQNCATLVSIVVPDTIVDLGEFAFGRCNSLTYIVIPDSVVTIGNYCFQGCVSLANINIPNSVTNLEDYCFHDCVSLTKIIIPNSVSNIGNRCFSNCNSLTDVAISDSITTIGSYCFASCTALANIYVTPLNSLDSMKSIMNVGNSNVVSLMKGSNLLIDEFFTISFNGPWNNPSAWASENLIMRDFSGGIINSWDGNDIVEAVSYSIKDGITSIEDSCFADCEVLTDIVIPNSINMLGEDCFSNCTSLINVRFSQGEVSVSLSQSCFASCTSLTNIIFPKNINELNSYCFSGCASLVDVYIPEGATRLGTECFHSCRSLVNLVIPNSITTLSEYCFTNCSSLTNIVIPSNVTYIGPYCFRGCTSLISIVIPDKITSTTATISRSCFRDCSSLISVTIPEGIITLDDGCFSFCTSLTDIIIPSSVTNLGDYCFKGCDSLVQMIVPVNVTYIGVECFSYCGSLTDIVISDGILTIGRLCFYDSINLSNIYVFTPASLLWKMIAIMDVSNPSAVALMKSTDSPVSVVSPIRRSQSNIGIKKSAAITFLDKSDSRFFEDGNIVESDFINTKDTCVYFPTIYYKLGRNEDNTIFELTITSDARVELEADYEENWVKTQEHVVGAYKMNFDSSPINGVSRPYKSVRIFLNANNEYNYNYWWDNYTSYYTPNSVKLAQKNLIYMLFLFMYGTRNPNKVLGEGSSNAVYESIYNWNTEFTCGFTLNSSFSDRDTTVNTGAFTSFLGLENYFNTTNDDALSELILDVYFRHANTSQTSPVYVYDSNRQITTLTPGSSILTRQGQISKLAFEDSYSGKYFDTIPVEVEDLFGSEDVYGSTSNLINKPITPIQVYQLIGNKGFLGCSTKKDDLITEISRDVGYLGRICYSGVEILTAEDWKTHL